MEPTVATPTAVSSARIRRLSSEASPQKNAVSGSPSRMMNSLSKGHTSSSPASSPSPPQSQNILTLMQQLQETRDALCRSEARREVVEDENKRLRAETQRLKQEVSSRPAAVLLPEVVSGPDAMTPPCARTADFVTASLQQELQSKDCLITELQRQLTETLRRNTLLEGEFQEHHKQLRHHFESHVDRLELELRRGKARQSSAPSAALLQQSAAPASSKVLYSGGQATGPAASFHASLSPMHGHTRRDLL